MHQRSPLFCAATLAAVFVAISVPLFSEPAAPRLSVAHANDRLLRDGKPYFYLADTVWSAFTNPTEEEWAYYLDYRKRQGFNALQINILPQGDRSTNTWENPLPFEIDANGRKNYDRPNPAYFRRAQKLVAMAVERGFVPALVVMWGDLVQDSIIHKTYKTQPLRKEQIRPYVDLVVDTFGQFNPIWIVSGDSDLPNGGEWYKIARDRIKERVPHQLCTFHLSPDAPLPGEWTDIYMTYTGHGIDNMAANYTQAIDRASRKPKHPVLNAEPCYEAHGSGLEYRFSQADIRKAMWWSLLSGAKAGFTYGAHGIWCWHRTGQSFPNQMWAQNPLDWRVAITLPGAEDAAFARSLFEQHDLVATDPAQDLLQDMPQQVRMSATADRSLFALYLAFTREVKVKLDLSRYELTMLNLSNRNQVVPIVHAGAVSTVAMPEANSDFLIIGRRRETKD